MGGKKGTHVALHENTKYFQSKNTKMSLKHRSSHSKCIPPIEEPTAKPTFPEGHVLTKEEAFATGLPDKPKITLERHGLVIEGRFIVDLSKTSISLLKNIIYPYSFSEAVKKEIYLNIMYYYSQLETFMDKDLMVNKDYNDYY